MKTGRVGVWNARRGVSTLGAGALVVAIGLLWLAAEMAAILVAFPNTSLPELLRRFLRVLPWHAAIFLGWAVGIAGVARALRLSARAVAWLAVGAGTFSFLGARLFEGLWRSEGPAAAALGALGVALGVVLALGALAAAGRLLPASLRRGWTAGALLGWTLGFVLFLERLGYEIGRARPDFAKWPAAFSLGDVLPLAAAAVGALLAASRLRPGWRALGALLLLAPFALPLAERERGTFAPASGSGPDVVVVLLDTVRGDLIGPAEDGTSLTPQLDAIAREAITFPNAFSPSNWTRGAMPGVLASLPYPATGNFISESVELLAESLRAAGWSTAGVSANPLIAARFGWSQGFDQWEDPHTLGDFLVTHPLQVLGAVAPAPLYRIGAVGNDLYFRDAAEIRRRAIRQFDRAGRPAFLYLQLMDAHGPYLPPHEHLPAGFRFADVSSYYRFLQLSDTPEIHAEPYRDRLDNFRQRYAASIRHLDAQLGRLVAELRARGRWDETLFWVVSDHGEAFGEHSHAGHTGMELGNVLIHVPLLLKTPRSWGIAPRVEPLPVSTYDLRPTTLALLGLDPADTGFGTSLAGLVRNGSAAPPQTIFSDAFQVGERIASGIRWPWKLVVIERDGNREERLYQLEEDPSERDSIAAAHPEIVRELSAEIAAFRARTERAKIHRGADREVDALTEEQLRRLGYVH